MASARRLIFFGISQGIHCRSDYTVFFIFKKLKAVATATAAIVLLTPANFYHSQDKNLTFSLSPSLLRPLAKNLQKQKLLLGPM
jgi:hypothetical protein